MGFDSIQRAQTSYLEYLQIIEGKRRDREYEEHLARQVCFYQLVPHQGKNRKIRKPSDLWKIGDEIDAQNIFDEKTKAEDQSLRDYGKKNGILIV